jgi:cold shock CspA family protein
VAFGTVAFWHSDYGWGAITATDREGLGFVAFSQVRGMAGFVELAPGQEVEYEWASDRGQDGCQWVAEWVRPAADSSST